MHVWSHPSVLWAELEPRVFQCLQELGVLILNINHKRTQQAQHSHSLFLNVAVPEVVA